MQYKLWIIEYAYIPDQPLGSILLGRHNGGTRMFPMTYCVAQSREHNIMIDVGTNHQGKKSLAMQKRDHIQNWHGPDELLRTINLRPEDIDTIILTHAHFDHIDNLDAFPNAAVYLQKKEYYESKHSLSLDIKYQSLNKALNYEDFDVLDKLLHENRLQLIDGDVKDLLPGISVYPSYYGHSFASQSVVVDGCDGNRYVCVGDLVYSIDNYTASEDGSYTPVGLSVGTPMALMRAMDDVLHLAGNDYRKILIAHEPRNWENYSTVLLENGLHIATICN